MRALIRLLACVDLKVSVEEVVSLGALKLPSTHGALNTRPDRRPVAAFTAAAMLLRWPLPTRTRASATLQHSTPKT